jgi:hypothetical protein
VSGNPNITISYWDWADPNFSGLGYTYAAP